MQRLNVSRRTLVKGAAALGALAGLSSGSLTQALAEDETASTSSGDVKVVRSGCRACGKMECGVLVTVRNGKAVKVEGDPTAFQSMGNCCSKSQASIQACYHPDRLYYPMKRTNPKDYDDPGWVRISWDEALTITATKIQEIIDKFGGETLVTYAGTSRVWNAGFGSLLETPNGLAAWQVCKGPRHFVGAMQSEMGFSWMETVGRPRVYVQWGGASEISNYDDSCRTTVDVATKADVHIVVDPRLTNLGKGADQWLNLRPGTDGALAMAWANVAVENELYDEAYVKKWTNAPFLVVRDMEPTTAPLGSWMLPSIKTRLLKESDLVEGGKPTRFMVWDSLGNRLTYFDADPESGLSWEGEDWKPQTKGFTQDTKDLLPGVSAGFVCGLSGFGVEDGFAMSIEPALYGEYDVTLKDGATHKARPVWDMYAERLQDYTPEKVAEITNLSAESIRTAALSYLTRLDPSTGYGNGGIQYMLANEHYGTAAETCRALDVLVGISGNFDTPGGNRGTTRAAAQMDVEGGNGIGMAKAGMTDDSKRLGMEDRPLLAQWWPMWGDACHINKAMQTGEPYPLKGGMCGSGNFMNMANAKLNYEGLQTLDFFFTLDMWFAPITGISDVLFPVLHWIEVNSPRRSQGSSGAYGATIRAVEPPAEAAWDQLILEMLAKYMGVPYSPDPENPWPGMQHPLMSPEHVKEAEMAVLDANADMVGGWEAYSQAFAEHGWFDAKLAEPYDYWGHYRRFEVGQMRRGFALVVNRQYPTPAAPGLSTPTAKHEIWSTIMETCRPDEDRELPKYIEPIESPLSTPELFEKYPFTCMTGRRIPVYFHSEHRQLPWCRELWPVPRVEINPADAAELGINQGDWVWIENDRGKIRQTADLYYGIKPGMINLEHQWWFPELKQADRGFALSCANVLVDPMAADSDTGASMVRGYAVKIYKATPENSPFGNPVPCGNDGTEIIHDSSDPRLKEWVQTYEGRE